MATKVASQEENLVRKAALRESEQKFRNIVEHSGDGIYLANEEGVIIEWNPGMVQITGLTRQEVMGQPFWDVRFRLIPDERKTRETYVKHKTRILRFIQTGKAKRSRKLLASAAKTPPAPHPTSQMESGEISYKANISQTFSAFHGLSSISQVGFSDKY